MRTFFIVWLAALALSSGGWAAEDTIYRCRDAAGVAVYSDKPCAAAKDMQQISIAPPPLADISDVKPLCASESGARSDLKSLDRGTLAKLTAPQRHSVNEVLADYARDGARSGARWGRGPDQSVHLCLPTFANEIVEYVAVSDGKLIQMRGGMVSYRNDPDTPGALLERCAQTWKQCIEVPDANPDSCVAQIPTCPESEPWKGGRNCCPLQCKTTYHAARVAGVPGSAAFLSALYESPSCIPGITPTIRNK